MFRDMRRFKQALSEEECIELLKNERRGVMSCFGEDGYPYGMPLDHFYDEETGKLYFHGANQGHKIDAIKNNPKVCYTVFGQDELEEGDWAYYVKSVVIFGQASLVEDMEKKEYICRKLCSLFPAPDGYADKEIELDLKRVLCIEISIDHMTGKRVHEN